MSATICIGLNKVAWSCRPEFLTMEIEWLPAGVLKVRRRMRPKRELRLFLKYADRIEEWIPEIKGDKLALWLFKGCNKTQTL